MAAEPSEVRIKICGLMRQEDTLPVNEVLPEYAGFIFAKGRRRTITAEQALKLRSILDPRITTVGVFVGEPTEEIIQIAASGAIGMIQLHGRGTEEEIRYLQRETSLPVIRAYKADTPETIREAERSCADYILLDQGAGGSGMRFDWSLLKGLERPYFLAGGLDPDNIGEALLQWKPFAVDVSSGVETDGRKDPQKIRRFVENARGKQRKTDQ